MKFIHAADLHLDSPFQGLSWVPAGGLKMIRQSTFTAAARLFDLAIEQHVDFVLLVGDLFDRAEQSVRAQSFLIEQFNRLAAENIPVIVGFGNHDFQADTHLGVPYPDNVTVLPVTVTTHRLTLDSGERVAITGFSYPQRWVIEDMVADYPVKGDADWHIGLLHGALRSGGGSDNHYAPFTLAALKQRQYDYWALGHIHQAQILSTHPLIVYPGVTQGRQLNETGTKGAYLVTSQGHTLSPHFFTTASLRWESLVVDASAAQSLNELSQVLMTALSTGREEWTLVQLRLCHADQLTLAEGAEVSTIDWLTLFSRRNQTWLAQRHWLPIKVSLEPSNQLLAEGNTLDEQYWTTAATQVFADTAIRDRMGKLLAEPFLADWFDATVSSDWLREQTRWARDQQQEGLE